MTDFDDLSIDLATKIRGDVEFERRLSRKESVDCGFEGGSEEKGFVLRTSSSRVSVVEFGVLLDPEVEIEVLCRFLLESEVIFEIS